MAKSKGENQHIDPEALASILGSIGERERRLSSGLLIIGGEVDSAQVPQDTESWIRVIEHYRHIDRKTGLMPRKVHQGVRRGVVQASPIDTLAVALLRFRQHYAEDFTGGKMPVLLDMGSNDGRVVVLAHLLGYRSLGIELDFKAYEQSRHNIRNLSRIDPSLREENIVRGDYNKEGTYQQLKVKPDQVGVFFNYADGNAPRIGRLIQKQGRAGAKFLLHTPTELKEKVPLNLVAMVRNTDGFPTYDVFQKG